MTNQAEQTQTFDSIRAVAWKDNGVVMLDQRLLPEQEVYIKLDTSQEIEQAIRDMVVRGAPAIGITAAYGVVMAAREAFQNDGEDWQKTIISKLESLLAARPTAINLFWAVDRMRREFGQIDGNPESILLQLASTIHEQDVMANRRMGELGAELLTGANAVLTHCNTGSLATGGYGTALGVIRNAYSGHKISLVYVSETRPWLQGSRLTAWELKKDEIPMALITEGTAAHLMSNGKISWVVAGADRIAANGDVANKIGTYTHAICARHHGVGFMVVAPTSSIDIDTPAGSDIEIEQRDAAELTTFAGKPVSPAATQVYNPVFDITPADLIDVIVTEKNVIHKPDKRKIMDLFGT